ERTRQLVALSETYDPRSLGRTLDKIEASIKLPGSRHKVTYAFFSH
ncbi:mCG1034340, partial [Mus musculus]